MKPELELLATAAQARPAMAADSVSFDEIRAVADSAKDRPWARMVWLASTPESVIRPDSGVATLAGTTLFAGVHRGFAPPRVKDAITNTGVSLELDPEMSWNYEAGARA